MDRNENRLRRDVPIEELFETTNGGGFYIKDSCTACYYPYAPIREIQISITKEKSTYSVETTELHLTEFRKKSHSLGGGLNCRLFV